MKVEVQITFLQWELKKKWQSVNFLFEFIPLQVFVRDSDLRVKCVLKTRQQD